MESQADSSLRSRNLRLTQVKAQAYFQAIVVAHLDALLQLDDLIADIDGMLDKCQPAHTGRIRVMWISRHKSVRGYGDEKLPVAAEWSRNKLSGRWTAKKLPVSNLMRRTKTSGEFQARSQETRQWLVLLQELLARHGDVRRRLTLLDSNWVKSYPSVAGTIRSAEQQLLRAQSTA